jgi:hypothetical protein
MGFAESQNVRMGPGMTALRKWQQEELRTRDLLRRFASTVPDASIITTKNGVERKGHFPHLGTLSPAGSGPSRILFGSRTRAES